MFRTRNASTGVAWNELKTNKVFFWYEVSWRELLAINNKGDLFYAAIPLFPHQLSQKKSTPAGRDASKSWTSRELLPDCFVPKRKKLGNRELDVKRLESNKRALSDDTITFANSGIFRESSKRGFWHFKMSLKWRTKLLLQNELEMKKDGHSSKVLFLWMNRIGE